MHFMKHSQKNEANNRVQRTSHKVRRPLTRDVVRRKMTMKWLVAGLILGMASGCACLPQSVQMHDGEIEGYRAIALRALNSPDVWHQHQLLMPFVEREVDSSRKIWFDIRAGTSPVISVWVPTTETNRINPFVVFEFDHSSHTLKRIALGSVNHL